MKRLLFIIIVLLGLISCHKDFDDSPPIYYKLTVIEPRNGTVNVESGMYIEGTELKITATPNRYGLVNDTINWEFNMWNIEGGQSTRWDSKSNPITIIITNDIKIEPTFLLK